MTRQIDAVVVGEALVDLVPAPLAGGDVGFRALLGGAPRNAAIAAARLGARVAFAGPLSTDGFGDRFVADFHAEGVDTTLAPRIGRPTALAVVHVDDEGQPAYDFHLAGTSLDVDPDRLDLPDGAALVVVLGAIGLDTPPLGRWLRHLVEVEAGRRPIWLDPNVRPSAIGLPDAHRRLLVDLMAHCDVVKLSLEDLGLLGIDERDDWLPAGPALVVLTLGDRGLRAFGRGDGWSGSVAVPRVPADPLVDTVGAGDTVTGALFAALAPTGLGRDDVAALPRAAVEDALHLAARAAAATCQRAGADPPRSRDL